MPTSQTHSELSSTPEGIPGPGEVIGGKYRVESVIGAGGMGVVLSARHMTLGQLVAIKVLVIADEEARREGSVRLLREARAAAALTGDHVVRIYDMGEDALGRPFIVMERLFGVDLGEVLRAQGALPVNQAATLVIQTCHALAEAHALGIVHRDLKPSNLFLTRRSDGTAHVKVLDFGIAKSRGRGEIAQETLTGARVTLGSPSYMSPEQVRDARNVDARTDVWSLGAILFELVTGRLAFQGSTLLGVCASIITDTPVAPSTLMPEEGSSQLDAIILRCLEKDKMARFSSVEELSLALEPFAAKAIEFTGLVPSSWTPETMALANAPPEEPAAVTSVEPSRETPAPFLVQSRDRTLESGPLPERLPHARHGRKLGRRLLIPLTVFALSILSGMLWQLFRARPEGRPVESVRRMVVPSATAARTSPQETGSTVLRQAEAEPRPSVLPPVERPPEATPPRATASARVTPRARPSPRPNTEPEIRLSR